MKTNRIIAFDYLKGAAIFLVVWCHCIQYITKVSFNNTFYSVVYSFHMPLFIIISGYLFSKKLNDPTAQIITRQFKRLIIPNIAWGVIVLVLESISTPPQLFSILRLPFFCWFLSSLFICSIAYVCIFKLGIKNPIISTILLSVTSLFLEGCEFIKFFIPFFGIGLILAQKDLALRVSNWKYIIVLGGIIFVLYSIFWSREFYIYRTPNPSIIRDSSSFTWVAYCARIFFGSLISVWLISFVRKIGELRDGVGLYKLSLNSLGIYVIHFSFFDISQKYFAIHLNYQGLTAVISMLIISFVMIYIINKCIDYLRINEVTRRLFLGEFKKQ